MDEQNPISQRLITKYKHPSIKINTKLLVKYFAARILWKKY